MSTENKRLCFFYLGNKFIVWMYWLRYKIQELYKDNILVAGGFKPALTALLRPWVDAI